MKVNATHTQTQKKNEIKSNHRRRLLLGNGRGSGRARPALIIQYNNSKALPLIFGRVLLFISIVLFQLNCRCSG